MNCKRAVIFISFLCCLWTGSLFSQIDLGKVYPDFKKYDFKEIYDSTYGIVKYNALIFAIGGDSIRYDHKGHNAQGWIEDYYTSGKVLHKGYYVDGQLRVFKNFYESGEVERTFRLNDGKKSAMTIYYADGKIKSDLTYFGETVTSQTDFFPTGMKEYEEEYDKSGMIMYKKISYQENGLIESSLLVEDKKKKKYVQKEFYPTGKLKVEGEMKLDMGTYDFVKEGLWNYYDEGGSTIKSEKYHNGSVEGS